MRTPEGFASPDTYFARYSEVRIGHNSHIGHIFSNDQLITFEIIIEKLI